MSNSIKPFDSIKLVKETDTEFLYKCPFCSDSPNPSHAHCYISKRYPIFYCQRCGKSGSLNELSKFINEPCKRQYNSVLEYDLPNLDISKILREINELLKYRYMNITDEEKEYFRSRTRLKRVTMDTAVKFSLFPNNYAKDYLLKLYGNKFYYLNNDCIRIWTMRGLGSGISGRAIKDSQIRYVNGDCNMPWNKFIPLDCYFIRSHCIQSYNTNTAPSTLVIAEGIYDICNIFLNRSKFMIDDKTSMFIAVQCSTYSRALKMYNFLYNIMPKNIVIFADCGIGLDKLRVQFKNGKELGVNIKVNYPSIKDWEPIGPIKYSIDL